MTLDTHTHVPPETHFEEQAALQLLVPRAKLLAALADAYGAEPAAPVLYVSPEQLSEHSDPDAEHGRYLPARKTPAGKFTQPLYALPPAAPATTDALSALGAPGEVVKAIREYLGVHPDLQLGGQVLDSMALELSRIALDYPADLIGALALEELMQLGYTVEAGAILPPRDLPENACEFFGVRPVAVAGPDWDKTRDSLSMLMMGFASNPSHDQYTAWAVLDAATEPGMPLAYLRGAAPAQEAPAALAAKPGGMIAVPFDLVVAACSAIDKKRDAPKILAELRRYTTGHLARALEAPAATGDEREAFEAWALAKTDWKPNMERKGDGYVGAFAQSAWDGWRGRGAAPASGSWIAAADVDRLVRELDVALHGEADAAPQAALCDIVGLTKTAARQLGRPVLGAVAALASDTALLDAMTRHRIALVPEFEGPWDAEIYNEDAEARSIASGNTPREALRAALAAQAKEGGA